MGYLFGGNTGQTAASLRRQRAAGETALAAGSSTAPVQGGIAEALTRVLGGGVGGYFAGQAKHDQQLAALPQGVKDAAAADPTFDGVASSTAAPYAGPGAPSSPAKPFNVFRMGGFGLAGKGKTL